MAKSRRAASKKRTKKRPENLWIKTVKKCQKRLGIEYSAALKHPECRAEYVKAKGGPVAKAPKRKSKKVRKSRKSKKSRKPSRR